MNKDNQLKRDPQYQKASLRSRVESIIKGLRDETEELDMPQNKILPIIPVTGSQNPHKYLDNKSRDVFK